MKKLLIAFLLLAPAVVHAQTTVTRAAVSYKIKNLGIMTEGKFGGLQAVIKFDPAHLDAANIEASVDVNTVDSDNETRDRHLKGQKFFDAVNHPRITLKSVSFQHKGGNNYLGKFNVTIKGITQPVDLPFTYSVANGKAVYNGSFTIMRRDFNVGSSSLVMADEVLIAVSIETPFSQ